MDVILHKHNFVKIILFLFINLLFSVVLVYASPTLSQGSKGHEVAILQQTLVDAGYNIPIIDGFYGLDTERAVSEFQKNNKLKVTGKVNNATWRKLKKISHNVTVSNYANNKYNTQTKFIISKYDVPILIKTAKSYIGVPYKYGGTNSKGFDCSGYLQYLFKKQGFNIPRTADEQYNLGVNVSKIKDLAPGDLVFFSENNEISHCGIYLGKGEFIHASTSQGIRVDALYNDYWKLRYAGGKRIVE